jgi:hypothetical protein
MSQFSNCSKVTVRCYSHVQLLNSAVFDGFSLTKFTYVIIFLHLHSPNSKRQPQDELLKNCRISAELRTDKDIDESSLAYIFIETFNLYR